MYIGAALITALFLVQTSIPAGTEVTATLETTVKTATSRVDDEVVASLARNISSSNGVAIPRGALLRGRIETIQSASATSEGRVRLVFREIDLPTGQRVDTWMTNSFTARGSHEVARYIVFTGIGAGAGGLIAGKSTRVAGIIGGTLAGFVLAGSRNNSKANNLVLKSGQEIRLQLGEDLVIR